MTIKNLYLSLLKDGKKYNISEIDIRYLIFFFQNYKNINDFFLNFEHQAKNVKKIKNIFEKLKKEIPLAYLIHETFFLGNKYFVNKNVLIPRMETEELVLLTIKNIKKFIPKNNLLSILDIGTGSGIIIIEIAKFFNKNINIKLTATDISSKALKIAKKNANFHNIKNINFEQTNVFPKKDNYYNVIIANPPYIKAKNEKNNMHKYEPHLALYLTKKNNIYEKIFKNFYDKIKRPAIIIFEIDENILSLLNNLINKYLHKEDIYKYDYDINQKIRFLSLFIK